MISTPKCPLTPWICPLTPLRPGNRSGIVTWWRIYILTMFAGGRIEITLPPGLIETDKWNVLLWRNKYHNAIKTLAHNQITECTSVVTAMSVACCISFSSMQCYVMEPVIMRLYCKLYSSEHHFQIKPYRLPMVLPFVMVFIIAWFFPADGLDITCSSRVMSKWDENIMWTTHLATLILCVHPEGHHSASQINAIKPTKINISLFSNIIVIRNHKTSVYIS